jgi:hypothetical protein
MVSAPLGDCAYFTDQGLAKRVHCFPQDRLPYDPYHKLPRYHPGPDLGLQPITERIGGHI